MGMIAGLGYHFDALYFGGGTPTILIDELLNTIELSRHLFGIKEVSCETNPNHLTKDVGTSLKGYVQRLSIGVQSFNDDLLKSMNRFEKFGSGAEILKRIQSFNQYISTLNIDLIFNFPHQTDEMLLEDIRDVISSGANQVTCYPLMSAPSIEEKMDKTFGKIDYLQEAAQYFILTQALCSPFSPTTAWTFSRNKAGMIDEYIVDYDEYVGIGSGALSFLNGNLYLNTFSLREYDSLIQSKYIPVVGTRHFKKSERMRYRFLMDLFGLQLDKIRFFDEFNIPIERGLWKEMAFFRINGGFSRDDDQYLTISPKGRYLLVGLMREFFSGINTVRDQARRNLPPEEKALTI
jgi:coproporphyrinogen III oxidase-like Fe-S oxidoreductase